MLQRRSRARFKARMARGPAPIVRKRSVPITPLVIEQSESAEAPAPPPPSDA
jgi:hypothetical protein